MGEWTSRLHSPLSLSTCLCTGRHQLAFCSLACWSFSFSSLVVNGDRNVPSPWAFLTWCTRVSSLFTSFFLVTMGVFAPSITLLHFFPYACVILVRASCPILLPIILFSFMHSFTYNQRTLYYRGARVSVHFAGVQITFCSDDIQTSDWHTCLSFPFLCVIIFPSLYLPLSVSLFLS